jgi:tetratricopeptide (TPR) repeat protein
LRGAVEWYERCVKLVSDTENAVARILVIGRAAEALADVDRFDEAAALVDEALPIAQFARAPHRYALALRVQGRILVARGRDADAAGAFDEAIATFTQCDSRLERARTLCVRAELWLARGNSKQRAAAYADAIAVRDWFAAVGAPHDRANADALVSRHGPLDE